MNEPFQIKRRVAVQALVPGVAPLKSGAGGIKSGEPVWDDIVGVLYIGTGDDGSGNATAISAISGAFKSVNDADYTVKSTDRTVSYSTLTAARNVTLPPAAKFNSGVELVIIDGSGNCSVASPINVTCAGNDKLNNAAATTSLTTPCGFIRLRSDGHSNWIVFGRSPRVLVLTTSQTYIPSPGLAYADVYIFGGGGGGGGGCREATNIACSGGAGGGGGGFSKGRFSAAQIGASQGVTIAAGGAGGAGATASSTAGSDGVTGGTTVFGSGLLRIWGGGGGSGGQLNATASGGGGGGGLTSGLKGSSTAGGTGGYGGATGGYGAAGSSTSIPNIGAGGGGSPVGSAGGNGGNSGGGAGGGGAGGGVDPTSPRTGGNGGVPMLNGFEVASAITNITTKNGGDGASNAGGPLEMAGGGGAGGSSVSSAGAIAGNGGAGGFPGGGAGGGGSARDGATAGNGGDGGNGLCIIVEHF